ncbi:VanZ family protein [Avrilella dinanensis]|uniref:VanZ family protein n=1 Tax=Avrilella dinanensis TaxID=2008672 RepID=UPI00240997B3|nr:VanZ family protein [Avrilella dinanensis]
MRNKKTLLAVLWNVLILIFCLINLSNIDSVQKISFPHIDKIVHFVFYTTASFLWLWALSARKKKLSGLIIILIVAGLILFGLMVEILQDVFPTRRSFEWLDVLCNTAGVITGTGIYLIYRKLKPHTQ